MNPVFPFRQAFEVAEKELSIPPVMSAEDMAKREIPDKLTIVSYLSQFYELFKHELLPSCELFLISNIILFFSKLLPSQLKEHVSSTN